MKQIETSVYHTFNILDPKVSCFGNNTGYSVLTVFETQVYIYNDQYLCFEISFDANNTFGLNGAKVIYATRLIAISKKKLTDFQSRQTKSTLVSHFQTYGLILF